MNASISSTDDRHSVLALSLKLSWDSRPATKPSSNEPSQIHTQGGFCRMIK